MNTENNRKKGIVVVPAGGLANRMRALASALWYADALSRPLTVVWHKNDEFNASFGDIFETKDLPFKLIEVSSVCERVKYHLYYETPRKKNLYFSKLTALLTGSRPIFIRDAKSIAFFKESIKDFNDRIIISSGLQFADLDSEFITRIFKFTKEVESAKKRILGNSRPSVAVQIRRTDNTQSITNSPTELFEEAIITTVEACPSACIFLATDDSATKTYLTSKFPRNIICNPNEAERDTLKGMIDAAAEFKIMTECDRIYGSYWSSFSEFAAIYGDNDLIVVRSRPSDKD